VTRRAVFRAKRIQKRRNGKCRYSVLVVGDRSLYHTSTGSQNSFHRSLVIRPLITTTVSSYSDWPAMYSTRSIIAVPVVLLSAALCLSQNVERNQTVLLKEVHFSGDLGESADELREYTEFLTLYRLERKKLLEDASSAVGKALRHRGYWKAQVTPQLRSLKPSPGSKDAEVALELTIKAGK
jgi:hypothetical protein